MWNNMENTFQTILVISAIGVLLTGILLAIKCLFKRRFSAGWFYYIWLLVLVAMMVPVKVNWNKIQHNNVVSQVVSTVQRSLPMREIRGLEEAMRPKAESTVDEAGHRIISTAVQDRRIREIAIENFLNRFASVWVAGAAVALAMRLISYWYYLGKIRRTTQVCELPELAQYTTRKVKVRRGEWIPSPMLLGVFRPVLLLPMRELNDEQLHYVLSHEMTHLKRHDMLMKWFMVLVKSVHWFNPLVYWLEKQVEQECEISCDIAVTSQLSATQKKAYADTILMFLMGRRRREFSLSMGMAGTKGLLKKRFLGMKNATVISKRMRICSGVMTVLLLTISVMVSGDLMNKTFPYVGEYASSEHFCSSCQIPYLYKDSGMVERYIHTDQAGWYWSYYYECPKCGGGYDAMHFVREFNQAEREAFENLQAKQQQEQIDRWLQIRSEIRSEIRSK